MRELGCISSSGSVHIVAELFAESWHVVDLLWQCVDMVEQCCAGVSLVALWITCGQEALIGPPEVDVRPIDRATRGVGERCSQCRRAAATPGQRDVSGSSGLLGVGDGRDQTGTDGCSERVVIGVDEYLLGVVTSWPSFALVGLTSVVYVLLSWWIWLLFSGMATLDVAAGRTVRRPWSARLSPS